MGIDIGCGREIAVTEPFLDLLHGDAVGKQQRRAAMPLRYNYDKPEESRNIKGFQGFKPDF